MSSSLLEGIKIPFAHASNVLYLALSDAAVSECEFECQQIQYHLWLGDQEKRTATFDFLDGLVFFSLYWLVWLWPITKWLQVFAVIRSKRQLQNRTIHGQHRTQVWVEKLDLHWTKEQVAQKRPVCARHARFYDKTKERGGLKTRVASKAKQAPTLGNNPMIRPGQGQNQKPKGVHVTWGAVLWGGIHDSVRDVNKQEQVDQEIDYWRKRLISDFVFFL